MAKQVFISDNGQLVDHTGAPIAAATGAASTQAELTALTAAIVAAADFAALKTALGG